MNSRHKAHLEINRDVQWAQERLENIQSFYKRLHCLIDHLPVEIMEHFSSVTTSNGALYLRIPYNYGLIEQVKECLKVLGFEESYDFDYTKEGGTRNICMRCRDENSPFYRLDITIWVDAKQEGSTCVLVPIEWEDVMERKIKTYDRICPEAHPELFQQRDGKLVYIGDNLFPAPAELTKIF